jgi:hypothetical protein
MVRWRLGLIYLGFFTFSGCASGQMVDVINYETTARPQKPGSFSVELMHRGAVPDTFKIIGRVTVEARDDHDPNRILQEIVKSARKMGGDALLDYTVTVPLAHGGIPTGRIKYTADVIVFENPEAAP